MNKRILNHVFNGAVVLAATAMITFSATSDAAADTGSSLYRGAFAAEPLLDAKISEPAQVTDKTIVEYTKDCQEMATGMISEQAPSGQSIAQLVKDVIANWKSVAIACNPQEPEHQATNSFYVNGESPVFHAIVNLYQAPYKD